jgi:hypothetical protein
MTNKAQPTSNTSNTFRLTTLVSLMTACALLSACGGGSGGDNSADKSIAAVAPSGEASAATASAQSASDPALTPEDAAASSPTTKALAATTSTPAKVTTQALTSSALGTPSTASPTLTLTAATATIGKIAIAAQTNVATVPSIALPPLQIAQLVAQPTANTEVTASLKAAVAQLPNPVMLEGTGVPGTSMTNCSESQVQDFVEAPDVWTPRRLTPRDCALVKTATPVFAWSQPANRNTSIAWTFVLKDASGATLEDKDTSVPRLLMAWRSLPAGKYSWTASYVNKAGRTLTSESRRFEVVAGANKVIIPTATAVVAAATAKVRPRLLPAGVGFGSIVTLASNGEMKSSYAAFVKLADTALTQAVPPSPDAAPRSLSTNTLTAHQSSLRDMHTAEEQRDAIEALGYVGHLKNDTRYTKPAIDRLVALAGWDTNGLTSEANNDQANREIYVALAQGLDLLGDSLSAAQTDLVVDSLKTRLQQAQTKFPALDTLPYNSHLLGATGYITEALLYAVGHPKIPEAKKWLAQAYELWITNQGVWGGYDGGFGNGTAYGWYMLSKLPRQLAIFKLTTGLDLSNIPTFAKLGDQYMAMTPPMDGLRGAFGDDAEVLNNYTANSVDGYRMLAALTRNSAQEWYWRQVASNVTTKYALPAAQYMMLGVNPTRPTAVTPSLNSFAFEDAGLVAMHSKTADPLRSSVYFRSSSLGSFNHSHADNNAFTYVSRGKDLLISAGYYPYYESPHHTTVTRATRFKNALTFDGGIGQAEPSTAPTAPGKPIFAIAASGRVINYFDNGIWAATTGDATQAYRGRDPKTLTWTPLLTNAVRSIAMHRNERVVVIYDWATSIEKRRWELNFQAINPATVGGKTLKVSNGVATACIDVYGLSGNAPVLASGFPVKPENGAADQHRGQYSAATPSKELVAVTVIREDCRNVPVAVTFTGTSANVRINGGTAVVLDKRTAQIPQ